MTVKRFFLSLVYVCIVLSLLELGYLWYGSSTSSPITSPVTETTSKPPPDPSTIEEKVEACMLKANLNSEPLLTHAKRNARYFLDEYRQVIPENDLSGYRSHCWREEYFATWNYTKLIDKQLKPEAVFGNIGALHFVKKLTHFPFNNVVPDELLGMYDNKQYKSNMLCLPNVFLLGYEKCGSTFLFSFIDQLISLSTNTFVKRQFSKETQFWARFEAYEKIRDAPMAGDLGMYFLNYIPGINLVSKENKTDTILMDGTPNYMVEWPVFQAEKNSIVYGNVSNYCLLPAALSTLFPSSKFIAIMRNPVDMIYSNFWFSCTKKYGTKFPVGNGPRVFHQLVMSKLKTFNKCMRDISVGSISAPCSLDINYDACIKQRLHLLDKCGADIIANEFLRKELPVHCGEVILYYGMFYIHVRKWLSIVGRDNLMLLTLEELNENPSKVANDTIQFLDLRALSSSEVDRYVKKIMDSGKKHSQTIIDYKTDPRLQMKADTKLALERFYHPFNSLLAELLGSDKFMWF